MASNDVDRLSNVPDEVLSEILSLIPTKYAVRTSILSKRWRYKWTLVTNIDIDVLPFRGLLNCCAFVDRVLDLCKTTEIKLFRLRFSNLWVEKSRMTKWIDEAVRLNVRELDIQSALLEFPVSFLACKTLTKLTIESNRSWEVLDSQTPFNLPCVKTLDVAAFSNPSLNAFKLIKACPVLESLSFKIDIRLYEEEYRFSIPTLKHMKLRMLKSELINKVVLNVPNLEDLFISGWWCSQFVMEDFPSLVSVTFSDFHLTIDNLWPELLKGIIGAKSLYFMANSGLPDAPPFTNFLNLKHLELAGCWLKMFQFLERCSELEYLSIVETEQSFWIAPHSVATCIPNNLTTMKFENCMGRKDELEFLEYMLQNAEVLKTITISCKSGLMEDDELQLCAKLQKFPRASKCCEIKIVGRQGCVLIC